MGKRSDFVRKERDFYPTPLKAVLPLLPHLPPHTHFIEPCAGDGELVRILEEYGHICIDASDIEPQSEGIRAEDALNKPSSPQMDLSADKPAPSGPTGSAQRPVIITNPPWGRKFLHPFVSGLQGPAWLLFDADWVHTAQAIPYLPYLAKIVSVGRVKWIPDSKYTGKDNCAWHLFDPQSTSPAQFFGRAIA